MSVNEHQVDKDVSDSPAASVAPAAPAPAAVAAPAPAPTPEGGTMGSEVKDPVVGGSLRWSVSFPGSGSTYCCPFVAFGFLVALSLPFSRIGAPILFFCFLEVC